MKKLLSWLKWLDNNILHVLLTLFLFIIPLYPKLPFQRVEYTYISIRLEDLFVALLYLIFLIQVIRRKVRLKPKFLILFVLFWAAVAVSYYNGFYLQHTIRINQVGLLHALRRLEYMSVFFIAVSVIDSKKRFFYYLNVFFISLLLINLYGLGQRFLNFPAVQTMNAAFARGMILYLTPEARISSTFGGHFDLSAYLVFTIPILLGCYLLSKNKKKYFVLFVLSLIILLYTASRIAFIAYILSVTLYLLTNKKFRLWFLVLLLTGVLLYMTGDLTKRFLQTFQIKRVLVNQQTGGLIIDQKMSPKELPAGGFEIPGFANKKKLTSQEQAQLQKQILLIAQQQAIQEASQEGRILSEKELTNRTTQIASFINPEKKILCDISCATRLQIEWPRAIAAFSLNPILGAGPSSITEATDNDYLRWLGEFGLLGTILFLVILASLIGYIIKSLKQAPPYERYLLLGFLFGMFGLMINAAYIDVFEASKVAFIFWCIAGFFVGFVQNSGYEIRAKK